MKKLGIILFNIIMFIAILIGDYFYTVDWSLTVKSIASSLFVLQAVGNLIYLIVTNQPKRYAIWLIVALTIAMLGDVILNLHFILGAAIFAIGHIFFIVAYCQLLKFKLKDLIIGAIIFVISLFIILFAPVLNFTDVTLKILCIVYAFIISFMLGKALSNLVSKFNKMNLIIFIGSLLFYVSDAMLLFYNFGRVRIALYLCLLAYYPAQSLLANSALYSEK